MRMATTWMVLLVFGLLAGPALAADGGWSFEVLSYLWGCGHRRRCGSGTEGSRGNSFKGVFQGFLLGFGADF
jgi:hypothetical protein